MEGMGWRTFLPSTTKIGQIRFDAESVVSATSARDHGACLGRRKRVLGNPAAVALARDAFSTFNGDVFFAIVMGRPFAEEDCLYA
jgi:hypothetical protein